MPDFLYFTLIACGALLVLYILCSFFQEEEMVRSKAHDGTGDIEANQFYYLPAAALEIAAIARLVITKDAAGTITAASVSQILLTTVVKIVPDTGKVYTIAYKPSIFSNDTLSISINAHGLLEGINLTAEDRITSLVDQIISAPQLILNGEQGFPSPLATEKGEAVTIELRELTNNFFVSPEQVNAGSANMSWKIKLEGAQKPNVDPDASFDVKFEKSGQGSPTKTETKGLFTRTFTTVKMTVKPQSLPTNPAATYALIIPDTTSLVSLSITRTPFVKKTQTMKFTNGIATEASTTKPSEVEGFVGIPIKIGKALASIPAQLLSFRIEHIRKETLLQTSQQSLAKAELTNKKNEIAYEAELTKARLESQKTILAYETEAARITIDAQKALLKSQKDLIDAQEALIKVKKQSEPIGGAGG